MKIRATAYARYSTDRQTENSIAYQMNAIQEYCNKNDIFLVSFFSDEAFSGTNTERPGFQSMLASAQRHDFDAVVIYDISRGSRDVGDWFDFRKQMSILGIKVISASQPLGDALDPNNFLLELINVGLGQHQVLDTRKKSIAGKNERAKKGKFCGGVPPLGYDIVDGEYIINEAEATIVRKIFALYAAGHSYNYIIDKLHGSVGKYGRPLGKNSFHSILKNERYIGVYTWNKREVKIMGKWAGGNANPNIVRIENAIDPIIDIDTWRKVEQRMQDNKRKAVNKSKNDYLLSGLIECSECGGTYIGHTSTNAKGYKSRAYVCNNKYRTHTCRSKNINADELETFVVQHLKSYLLNADFEDIAQTVCDMVNSASPDLSAERKELRQIDAKINNGINAVLGGMKIPQLTEEIERLQIRKSELEDIILHNENQRLPLEKDLLIQMFHEAVENWSVDIKSVIKTFITKIYANVDGTFTVNIGVHINGCGDRT